MTTTSHVPTSTKNVALNPTRQEAGDQCGKSYQELVGELMWVTTGSDISNAIREVVLHTRDPKMQHRRTALADDRTTSEDDSRVGGNLEEIPIKSALSCN